MSEKPYKIRLNKKYGSSIAGFFFPLVIASVNLYFGTVRGWKIGDLDNELSRWIVTAIGGFLLLISINQLINLLSLSLIKDFSFSFSSNQFSFPGTKLFRGWRKYNLSYDDVHGFSFKSGKFEFFIRIHTRNSGEPLVGVTKLPNPAEFTSFYYETLCRLFEHKTPEHDFIVWIHRIKPEEYSNIAQIVGHTLNGNQVYVWVEKDYSLQFLDYTEYYFQQATVGWSQEIASAYESNPNSLLRQ